MRAIRLTGSFVLLFAQLLRGATLGDFNGTNSWASFVESDFPFFGSVLDARKLRAGWPTDNLTSRGIILNLGNNCWACFDTELLRMSAIWEGQGITPASMSQISYQAAGRKAAEGEDKLPRIVGSAWCATGLYPGWQSGEDVSISDPREPGPDPRELGRGPLARDVGRFKALKFTGAGVELVYEVYGTRVSERVVSRIVDGVAQVERRFKLDAVRRPLWLALGSMASNEVVSVGVRFAKGLEKAGVRLLKDSSGLASIRVMPSARAVQFSVVFSGTQMRSYELNSGDRDEAGVGKVRWPQRLATSERRGTNAGAYVVDEVALPLENPWKRNVRLADIGFYKDGRAAVVTFDGDVWIISGLADVPCKPVWRRYASGFHEPLSLCIGKGELFVFDRNGIWRLHDDRGRGEVERYELFSNEFAQTAETREFASGMRVAPDGAFIIAKGGQEKSFTGKANGRVLRVAPDGKGVTSLGWGLRQPFIGVNPRTGLVTASDQQGNYVPATPVDVIRDNQYYGFLPGFAPKEKYPAQITEPLVWIPHEVNASGAGEVWLANAKMGPLNDALIHIGYNRPEVFVVRLNKRGGEEQAAVMSVTQDFDFAPLNGAVNPADGQLYITGFQIWGTTARKVSGLARLRYTGAPNTLPREVAAMETGVLLRFDVALDPAKATNAANFSAERWNYKRTASYGSAHYKLDGSIGQEWMTASSAYLSRDGKSVFVGFPDMKRCEQMRIGWGLASADGVAFEQNAYLTPKELTKLDLRAEGFEPVKIDTSPRARAATKTIVSADEGKRLASLMGCMACHSTDGTQDGKVGPTWKGLYGTEVRFTKGEPAIADDDYLRQSMIDPSAKVVAGFDKSDAGMPSYAGILSEEQTQSIILFIQSLR